jgi:site-specific DNA-methyltransferase (adenine-specific)
MDAHYNKVKENEANGIECVKTEEEWEEYIANQDTDEGLDETFGETQKQNYLRYGSIYGKKYCVKTDYGSWDSDFTMESLDKFIELYYKKLRKGGTLIIFFDLWKITPLKEMMEKHRFKQLRMIEWVKTNPQPRNSRVNYLTNCKEIALVGVKDSNPTFNSEYDFGFYSYPLQGGRNRFHPTQKSLALFEDIIKKHSNRRGHCSRHLSREWYDCSRL